MTSKKSPFKVYGGRVYMAENGFMPKTISHSGLMTYMKCPRDYYYKYVLGIWNDEFRPAFALGHIVHKMLEVHLQGGDESTVFDTMMEEAKKEQLEQNMLIKCKGDPEKTSKELQGMYKMCFGMYQDNIKHLVQWQPLEIEKQFVVAIRDPQRPEIILPVRLRGVIDLVSTNHEVIDHKTAASFKDDDEYERDYQPYLYAMAMKELYGVYPEKVFFNSMLKRKRDFNTKVSEIDFDFDRLCYAYNDIVRALQGMLLGEWQKGGKGHWRYCDTCKNYK